MDDGPSATDTVRRQQKMGGKVRFGRGSQAPATAGDTNPNASAEGPPVDTSSASGPRWRVGLVWDVSFLTPWSVCPSGSARAPIPAARLQIPIWVALAMPVLE